MGEYRRRVGRAIEEFVRWMDDPGSYAFRSPPRAARGRRLGDAADGAPAPSQDPGPATAERPRSRLGPAGSRSSTRCDPDLLAQVVVPRDLTVEEARRMGAFLVTLVDSTSQPAPSD